MCRTSQSHHFEESLEFEIPQFSEGDSGEGSKIGKKYCSASKGGAKS